MVLEMGVKPDVCIPLSQELPVYSPKIAQGAAAPSLFAAAHCGSAFYVSCCLVLVAPI